MENEILSYRIDKLLEESKLNAPSSLNFRRIHCGIFTEKSCRATFAQQKCKKCLRNHFGGTPFQTPRTTREMKII